MGTVNLNVHADSTMQCNYGCKDAMQLNTTAILLLL